MRPMRRRRSDLWLLLFFLHGCFWEGIFWVGLALFGAGVINSFAGWRARCRRECRRPFTVYTPGDIDLLGIYCSLELKRGVYDGQMCW